MNEDQALSAFAALSNKSRLSVVRCLVQAGPEGMTAGDIARRVGGSPSQTSFHLSSLSENGLISSERQARRIIYRVEYQRIGDLVHFLLEDCCGGNPIVRSCCEPRQGC
ncbi:MAG: helix-turn-helix transcriptional regulator [Rhodospirillales bacterium]